MPARHQQDRHTLARNPFTAPPNKSASPLTPSLPTTCLPPPAPPIVIQHVFRPSPATVESGKNTMASEKQIEANRQNAQHSTGPVTPEGKAAAAQNAFKHGPRARKVLFGSDERLQQFRDEFEAQYQPRNFTEAALVE